MVANGLDLGWQLFPFAHEYAHHVQQVSGIMPRLAQVTVNAGSDRAKELGSRLELQADCVSGLVP